uniref:Uncharacterized protein n=1 Tax=Rhizophora mucronata TaxID=61149 RepID=A0A2P2QYL1_RHIMU
MFYHISWLGQCLRYGLARGTTMRNSAPNTQTTLKCHLF